MTVTCHIFTKKQKKCSRFCLPDIMIDDDDDDDDDELLLRRGEGWWRFDILTTLGREIWLLKFRRKQLYIFDFFTEERERKQENLFFFLLIYLLLLLINYNYHLYICPNFF